MLSPQQWQMLQYIMGQGGQPTLADLFRQGAFQMAGELHGFGDMNEQEKAQQWPPVLYPWLQTPIRPDDPWSYRPRMYFRDEPANDASLSQSRYG